MKFPLVLRSTFIRETNLSFNAGFKLGRSGTLAGANVEVNQARDMLAAAQAREEALKEELKLASETIHQLIATQQDAAFASYGDR